MSSGRQSTDYGQRNVMISVWELVACHKDKPHVDCVSFIFKRTLFQLFFFFNPDYFTMSPCFGICHHASGEMCGDVFLPQRFNRAWIISSLSCPWDLTLLFPFHGKHQQHHHYRCVYNTKLVLKSYVGKPVCHRLHIPRHALWLLKL